MLRSITGHCRQLLLSLKVFWRSGTSCAETRDILSCKSPVTLDFSPDFSKRKNFYLVQVILEKLPVGVALIDKNNRIAFFNFGLIKMLNWTSVGPEPVHLHMIVEGLPEEPCADILNCAVDFTLPSTKLIRYGMEPLPVRLSFEFFQFNEEYFKLCTFIDASDRFKMREFRNEFLRVFAHDLRTPLSSVRGFLNLLEAGAFSDEPKLLTQAIKRAERNLAESIDLLSDFLDLDKLDSACPELNYTGTSIDALFYAINEKTWFMASAKLVSLDYEIADMYFMADEKLLIRVLVNLVANAIKFSPPNSAVRVSSRQDGEFALFEVLDFGPGIASQERESIFLRFRQGKQPETISPRGSGLGLAICKKVVEAHGGAIGVKSNSGSGSIFWFTVPLNTPGRSENGENLSGGGQRGPQQQFERMAAP